MTETKVQNKNWDLNFEALLLLFVEKKSQIMIGAFEIKEYLDVALVPCGLLIIFIYHLFFLYRYLNQPLTTVLGSENRDKRIWVDRVVQASIK